MSSNVGSQLDDIAKYIDRLKEQKRNTEKCIQDLEKDRTTVEERIEELRRRKDELDDRLRLENERLQRQERTIHQGEVTYAKTLVVSNILIALHYVHIIYVSIVLL
ncbi:unnamed protein product [Cylicocyclus nassatus]|uniref:Uncharacterized protein n=1 Tax=Cylicocyclus nassatus TaxID=53992 RepID=A0AA36H0Y4_CYLNA|nr:unnamed protein product [Cylicocyclus nassatus]